MEVPTGPVHMTGRATGLGVGLNAFATVEDPIHDVANPRLARRRAVALARSQRSLARTQKGSANRAKARRRTARVEAKTAAQRADFQCSDCGAKAKPRLELSDRVFRCQYCGLVLERDRNAARNLNPDHPRNNNRLGCTGVGDDGSRTLVSAGIEAA